MSRIKGAVKTHAGNTAPPVEIQPPFGYRAHWVFAYFHIYHTLAAAPDKLGLKDTVTYTIMPEGDDEAKCRKWMTG